MTRPLFSRPSTKETLAAAKRSTGAPCSICCVSCPVEPKLKVTLVPSLCSNSLPISWKAGVRSEAAETVRVCGRCPQAAERVTANTNTNTFGGTAQGLDFGLFRKGDSLKVLKAPAG